MTDYQMNSQVPETPSLSHETWVVEMKVGDFWQRVPASSVMGAVKWQNHPDRISMRDGSLVLMNRRTGLEVLENLSRVAQQAGPLRLVYQIGARQVVDYATADSSGTRRM